MGISRVSCWWLSSSVWRWSSSTEVSFQQHPEAARATNTRQTWRQEFLGSRSSTVEWSSTRTAAAGTFLRFFQTIFENTSLWRLKRLVTLSTYRRYINKCIYVSVCLSRTRISGVNGRVLVGCKPQKLKTSMQKECWYSCLCILLTFFVCKLCFLVT